MTGTAESDADADGAAGSTAGSTVSGAAIPDRSGLLAVALVALVAGGGLVACARLGALALLVAVAVVQAVLCVAWVLGTAMPGRRGAFVVAALAAGGADVAVSVWPHGRLGTLVGVLGLAMTVLFAHQLMRGAVRVQLVSSLSAAAVLVLALVSAAALLQLRHEFVGSDLAGTPADEVGGRIAAAVAGAALAGVIVAALVDVVVPLPRFDPEVPRGMLGLLAAVGVGASVAHLLLGDVLRFAGGRGWFLGAAAGGLAGLVAVASAFVQHTTPPGRSRLARAGRPVFAALLPLCLVAPAAFLLCQAIGA